MAQWTVSPAEKKSIEEHEMWQKGDMVIRRVTGWRWGTWTVTTSDDEPPQFELEAVPFGSPDKDSVDMNNCFCNNIEDAVMEETSDGWYENIIWPDDMDEEEQERLEQLWEEDAYVAWEEEGWDNYETQMWVWGKLSVEQESE